MKILVLVKQVPDTATQVKISGNPKAIETTGITWIVSPYDEFAVEEALRIKEKRGSVEVVAVSLGPDRVKEALRSCLAMGCDRAIHLSDPAWAEVDTLTTAKALAAAVKQESFSTVILVRTGENKLYLMGTRGMGELMPIPRPARITGAEEWRFKGTAGRGTFVPLAFQPGEAFQFDWSEDWATIAGENTKLHVAHIKLSHSRAFLLRAYLLQTHEMLFDAHWHAFRVFGGVPRRGIYDNMKTAVDAIFVGRDRQYNRRFQQMCGHYLVEPVACTPASGWEKGQVENQVGLVRERFFTPRLRFKNYDELNAWLTDKCIAYAKAHRHPELTEQTIWEVFEAERSKLVPYAGRFDGFHAVPASVSKTCLVRFDNNKYSVAASAVGRPVEVHAYADRIVIRQDILDEIDGPMLLHGLQGFHDEKLSVLPRRLGERPSAEFLEKRWDRFRSAG